MSIYLLGGLSWLAWWLYWIAAARNAKRTQQKESLPARLKHLVPLTVAMLLIYNNWFDVFPLSFPFGQSVPGLSFLGLIVIWLGLGFAVWARIHLGRNWSAIITLKEEHELIQSGPYALVRNPIYTGYIVATMGSALILGQARGWLAVVITIVTFALKIRREEGVLSQHFGQAFRDYCGRVKALMPGIY